MCSIPSWHSSPAWYTFIQQWNPFTWKPVHVQWHRKWNSYITIMFWTQMRQWIFGQCSKGPEQVVGSTNSNLNYALYEALTPLWWLLIGALRYGEKKDSASRTRSSTNTRFTLLDISYNGSWRFIFLVSTVGTYCERGHLGVVADTVV